MAPAARRGAAGPRVSARPAGVGPGARGPDGVRAWVGALSDPAYQGWDLRKTISGIRAPLLSLQGTDDNYGLPSQLDGIKEAAPHPEIELMPGIGHFPQVEAPDRIAERAPAFVAGHTWGWSKR